MQILLVDDEMELTEPLRQVLLLEGYEVDTANEGIVGMQLAMQNSYDLLILDWMMPQKSGLEICRELRSHSQTPPVLFLTAKDTLDDRVLGLDAGADDYLVKPFELRELLARVRALLRRSSQLELAANSHLKVADLELDRKNQIAYRGDRAISLSEKEAKLLLYFMQNTGQLLTHQQIFQFLWRGEEQPNSNVLAALVRLLRRKIEAKGESTLIHTIYGKGYRFGL
ncbi:two-component system response regulator RppA [Spirulina sp. 06S082]|uniref:two-component system response regulator RppA n=1 Tax=Spirulina sp. 06S082 TaxID=3110248 RepID=UPI002B21BC54|nr:two-component system response regulator RppA [Spirulina sp. 06S082]MEA5470926.1 two-component system response regulator RppA [Spirulina sp. 06S082]